MPFLASLDHLVLTVSDLQRTLDFYCGVLGCEEVTFGDKRKAIRFGDQKINLLWYDLVKCELSAELEKTVLRALCLVPFPPNTSFSAVETR